MKSLLSPPLQGSPFTRENTLKENCQRGGEETRQQRKATSVEDGLPGLPRCS